MTLLRVALNLVALAEGGGGGARYGTELAGALAARNDVELHVFTSRDAPHELLRAPWLGGVRHMAIPVRVAGPPFHLAAQFGLLPAVAVARGLDVVHTPSNAGPVNIPRVACVVTLHDTTWLQAPDQWGTPTEVRSMRRIVALTAPRADRLVAGSHDTAGDLVRFLALPRERIDIVHHGVEAHAGTAVTPESELRERLGLGFDPVVLCVAQKRPFKNQELLVRALAEPALAGVRPVLPGARTEYEARLRAVAEELGVTDRVHLPDWVEEPDLEDLYRLAACFALPSRLEGFGLPLLEAMVRGVPVVCSDQSALPEVAGDAALLFGPDAVGDAACAISRLLTDADLRAKLVACGRERAARFTWDAAATATVASYRRAMAGRR